MTRTAVWGLGLVNGKQHVSHDLGFGFHALGITYHTIRDNLRTRYSEDPFFIPCEPAVSLRWLTKGKFTMPFRDPLGV